MKSSGEIVEKPLLVHSFTVVFVLITHDTSSSAKRSINISSAATESKRIACNLPFENQLFGYIHYCTEININLLLAACVFLKLCQSYVTF